MMYMEEEVKGKKGKEEFEVIVEWVIRKLKLPEFTGENVEERIKRWALYSLGLDEKTQDIYLYLEKVGSSTTTEIAKEFNISPTTARSKLDDLHALGLVDYIGREYHLTHTTLSRSINLVLIPRITDTLRYIAKIAASIEREGRVPTYVERHGRNIEKIVYFAPLVITGRMVEEWYRRGKKIRLISMGPIRFEKDIDPEIAESVFESIVSFGPVKIDEKLYTTISHTFTKIFAPIEFY